MHSNLATVESQPRAADSRSLFLERRESLHLLSEQLSTQAEDLGWPGVSIEDDIKGITRCTVYAGIDPQSNFKTWQIRILSQEDEDQEGQQIHLVHGRQVNSEEDEWRLMKLDAQGIQRHDVFINDNEGNVTAFVTRALRMAAPDSIVARELSRVKASFKKAYEDGKSKYPLAYYSPVDARQRVLKGAYENIGFSPIGITSLRNVVMNRNEIQPRYVTPNLLPGIVQSALTAPLKNISVPIRT